MEIRTEQRHSSTVCPEVILYSNLLHKMGQDFLHIQYHYIIEWQHQDPNPLAYFFYYGSLFFKLSYQSLFKDRGLRNMFHFH